MNLREAFAYQNYLTNLLTKVEMLICGETLFKVKEIHKCSAANPQASDFEVDKSDNREVRQTNDQIIHFAIMIVDEKARLQSAIAEAKRYCGVDIDTTIATNEMFRRMERTLSQVNALRPSERTVQKGGYKINANGDQVHYYYDAVEVKTIDFDRNRTRKLQKEIHNKVKEASSKVDAAMFTTTVDFTPKFSDDNSLEEMLDEFYPVEE